MKDQKIELPEFPAMLRKMWSGGEVQQWIDENIAPLFETDRKRRGEPVAKVRDRGFEVVDGKHVPTVLVEFPVDDWESRDRFAAAVDAPQPAEPVNIYVETRECHECGHVGINDAHVSKAACNSCDWAGYVPNVDRCPGCGQDGTMTAACPTCGGRYGLLAEQSISAPAPQPAEPVNTLSDAEIREVFLANGFTIKDGHDDLKPYVYTAARELIALAQGREP